MDLVGKTYLSLNTENFHRARQFYMCLRRLIYNGNLRDEGFLRGDYPSVMVIDRGDVGFCETSSS